MQLSESPTILFIRSVTLLVFLIAVPGIAVCWNLIPKNFGIPSAPKSEQPLLPKDSDKSVKPASATPAPIVAAESSYPPAPESLAFPSIPLGTVHAENASIPNAHTSAEAIIQQVSWEQSPQNYTSLVNHLYTLGATQHRLVNWGSTGELVRFSCTVAPSGNRSYEKYFQAIGTDAETVIRSVIADIEKWKN